MANHPAAYSQVLATVGLAKIEAEAVALAGVLEADGAHAQASQVRRAYLELLEDLRAVSVRVASLATDEIKNHEASSRVRPDTGGAGGPRLGDYVGKSDPLTEVEGSVGINDEEPLYDNVSWWWTNEEGFSGHVGRTIVGLFDPGHAGPNPAEFRVHPLFTPMAGGRGVIHNPIPPRWFVRDGARLAEARWHAEIRAAKNKFLARCDRALIAAPSPTPGTRRRARR